MATKHEIIGLVPLNQVIRMRSSSSEGENEDSERGRNDKGTTGKTEKHRGRKLAGLRIEY